MSNIILSSNENSALLQTLNQSESKVIDSIYSTRTISAPSATNWYTLTPKTGSATDGQSESYDLPKYGVLEQIVFSYTKETTFTPNAGGGSAAIVAGDFFNVVSRFEFLSSSRVLFTLYAEDILAQLKDLSTDEYSTVSNFLVQGGSVNASPATQKVTMPIVFSMFNQHNTCPNLQFNEPCQLRIVYNQTNIGLIDVSSPNAAPPTNAQSTISGTKIMLRYKMYSEADNAQLLASNYEEEQLNQLTSRAYRENPVSYTVGGNNVTDHKFTMELRNVDVVENFYFMVRENISSSILVKGATPNTLVKIKRVRLTASGQELADLDADQLLYMKVSNSGYPVNSSYLANQINDPISCNSIAKIQTGYWTWNKDVWSNGVSMRELNNVIAEVYCDLTANKTYTCYCQELTSCILSVASNTGRNAISLAN
jgi:hypothetical protein